MRLFTLLVLMLALGCQSTDCACKSDCQCKESGYCCCEDGICKTKCNCKDCKCK